MIRLHRDGAVARIVLDAPERRNALQIKDMATLTTLLNEVEDDTTLRVAILTGTGTVFCAGADLAELEQGLRPDLPLADLSDRIAALRVPVIGALNGGVFGAGLDLALACDLRLGVNGMVAQVPAAAIGVHYPGPALARARAALGPTIASRLFLTAERLSDTQCRDTELVSALYDPAMLSDEALRLATRIAGLAPLAVEGMKRVLVQSDASDARVTACFASADHAEALTARREKRKPVFRRA